jgi:arginase
MLQIVRPTPQREPVSIALVGVPLELGSGVRGALMGPAALRTSGLAGLLEGLGHSVVDHGDLSAPPRVALTGENLRRCRSAEEVAGWTQEIHDRAYAVVGTGAVPIFLGGDHAISMGTVSGVARHCAEQGKRLVVLWLDAHADYNTPATSPSGNMHGMPVAMLAGEPSLAAVLGDRAFTPLAPDQLRLFGLRSVDAEERGRLAAHGIGSVDMRAIDEFGVAALMRDLLEEIARPDTHLHVSLDIDFVDPALAPGVGTAVPGGATYREAHLVMEMLHDSGLVGSVDLVELNPFLDERGRSAVLMAELAASLFGRTVLARAPAARPATVGVQ